jgi:hypothetical protein
VTVHQVPDSRLDGVAAAPADALALIGLATARVDNLAALIRRSAPSAEVTAAAQAVAALREPLESLRLTAGVLDAALRLGGDGGVTGRRSGTRAGRPARRQGRARLRVIPGGAP